MYGPDIGAAAHPLDLTPLPFEAHSTADLQDAFDRIAQSGAQALMVLPQAHVFAGRMEQRTYIMNQVQVIYGILQSMKHQNMEAITGVYLQ